MPLFQGLCAFPITPADQDGAVDCESLSRLLRSIAIPGMGSIGLLGSTGTYAYLARRERRRAVRAAAEALAGCIPLMVGIGALRTDDAIDLASDAEAEGADGLLMAPVSYTPLTQEEVFEHYAAVAATTRLPLCIYNNPATTGFEFRPGLLDRLSQLPNIRAVKMPLPAGALVADELARLRGRPAGQLRIGYSGDWGMPQALLAGADAFYSVVAGFLPDQAIALAGAAMARDEAEVGRLRQPLLMLLELLHELGGVRVAYAALAELGLCDAAPPRPILPVSKKDRLRIAEALHAAAAADNSEAVA